MATYTDASATWADDLLKVAHDHRLALIRQLLREIETGTLSPELRTVIAAHDNFMASLVAARPEQWASDLTERSQSVPFAPDREKTLH